jgi:ribose transport system permease protein
MTTDTTVVTTPAQQSSPAPVRRARLKAGGQRFGLVLLLVILTIVFAVLPASGEAFRSPENIRVILANQAVGLLVALALLFPMAAGYFDFSVGAITATTSVLAATSMSRFDLPLPVAVLLAVGCGTLLGLGLGGLVAVLDMNPFIATLGTATLLGGVIFAYTNGLQITTGISPSLTDLGSLDWFGVRRIVIVAAVGALLAWVVIAHTPVGRALCAVGSNARAAALVGLRVSRVRLLAFVLSGTVAGVAGVLLLARQGAATSDNGMSMLFPALTAVLLSTIVIEPGRPSVLGTIVGILFVAISISGLTLVGAPAWVAQVFNGAALLAAVAVSRLSIGRRGHG